MVPIFHSLFQILALDYCARFLEAAMYIQKGNTMMFPSSNAEGKPLAASLQPSYKPENILFKQVSYN